MSKTKIHYDRKSDILYIVLKTGPEDYAEEISDGITVEYDKNNKPIGIEIFKASELLGDKLILKSKSQHSSASRASIATV